MTADVEDSMLLDVEVDSASRARRLVTGALSRDSEPLRADAELVVAELVTNAVLHGSPPVRLCLIRHGDGVRVEVHDADRRPPLRLQVTDGAMTGRGLALVAALSTSWGVRQSGVGKVVWADLHHAVDRAWVAPADNPEPPPAWPTTPSCDGLVTIDLGEVPTDLLLSAKAHVDNLVRELVLAAATDHRPAWLDTLVEAVVHDFADARTQIKAQAVQAATRHAPATDLVLHLAPASAAAGQRYLEALEEADRHARAARLLTLEAPRAHKAFRRWYVETIVEQLRHASEDAEAAGAAPD